MLEIKDNTHIGDSWDELDVQIPASKLTYTQNAKIKTCPVCKSQGKKQDSSLSVIPTEGKGRCHKCGTKFIVRKDTETNNTYTPPSRKNLTKLSEDGLRLFTDRMISQEAVIKHKIGERNGSVAFPYHFNSELVNIKYRGINEKTFSQSGGGLHVMYNHDNCKAYMESTGDMSVVIVEGEFDSLAFETAGIEYSVSVDSGAPNPNDNIDRKLECFTNSFELFEMANTIYIATDNDANGMRLQQELVRRLPFDKVKIIKFGDYKDANDVLRFEGREVLANIFADAKDVKAEGVFAVEDVEDELWEMYTNGLPKGSTTHFPSIDEFWKWRLGEVTMVTGYNNEGKSEIIHNMAIVKAEIDSWPSAFYTPENMPSQEWFEGLIHTYIGKTTDIDYANRMSPDEFKKGIDFLKKKVFVVHPDKDRSIDQLFERFDFLVRRYGVRIVVIDPYNQVEHLFKAGETTDLYVSRFMGRLKHFAVTRQVCVLLVAHQNPPKTRDANGNYPEPDLYTIKGGGTFADKADNVVVFWRPLRRSDEGNPLVSFISQKIKKKKLTGKIGQCDLAYQWQSNRFLDEKLKGKNPLEVPLAVIPVVQTKTAFVDTLF